MKPKVKLCKDILKKYKQLIEKENQINQLQDKLFRQRLSDKKQRMDNWRLTSHLTDEISVAKRSLVILRKEFGILMTKLDEEVKKKEDNETVQSGIDS